MTSGHAKGVVSCPLGERVIFKQRERVKRGGTGGQMLSFYRMAIGASLLLILATAITFYFGVSQSRLTVPLLPQERSALAWSAAPMAVPGDTSTKLWVNSEAEVVDFSAYVSHEDLYPYTAYALDFAKFTDPDTTLNLEEYQNATFEVRCDPQNVLLFVMFTHDETVTNLVDPGTRRLSWHVFSCDTDWKPITVNLSELHTPDWWLEHYTLELSSRSYRLDRVFGFAFVNSIQSPRDTEMNVKVTGLTLHGEDRRYLYAAFVVVAVGWLLFFLWLFRAYVKALIHDVKDGVKQNWPIIAYKELSIAPHKDKTRSALLRLMATDYANPELSMDVVVSSTGLNRAKINAILKEEIGLTFSAYLNKLRLTEAARLLSEETEASIAEIAHSVGYNNVTYFNKLFKAEYDYSPNTFKSVYKGGKRP